MPVFNDLTLTCQLFIILFSVANIRLISQYECLAPFTPNLSSACSGSYFSYFLSSEEGFPLLEKGVRESVSVRENLSKPAQQPSGSAEKWDRKGIALWSDKLNRVENPDLALEYFTRASHLEPSNILYRIDRINALMQLQRGEAALLEAEHVVSMAPSTAESYVIRGTVLH